MRKLLIGVPAKCQNGHAATWQILIDGLDAKVLSAEPGTHCNCPKAGLGEGYVAVGEPVIIKYLPEGS